MKLGTYGVWTGFRHLGEENGPDAVRLSEELGYGTFWLGGSPRLPTVRPLLAAAERIVIATGIVNVWAYEPGELADEYAALEADFPGRLLLGIGIGHPEATGEYAKPLTKMTDFLDGLDAADSPVPADRRCIAALGPKMLDLSAARSLGTHPYFVPVEHTRFARERLGEGPLIAPDGGSDRLIDDVVPQGTPAQIAAVARAHVDAGADHVCLQTVGVQGIPRDQWTALAGELGLG
jgi:probable F420-dependent oxidoreductase